MKNPLHILLLFLPLMCTSALNAQNKIPYGAQVMDQSAFAMGSMDWNVIFVEADDSVQAKAESWTNSEIAGVQTKIGEAASYWEGLTSGFHANAQFSININYVNGGNVMKTGYEPTTPGRSEIWINDVMGDLGYNNGNRRTNVRNFNQDTRVANQNHWAATIFVMDNTDANMDSYAYAYHGGPYTILTHNAAGWQPQNFNMVLAHEMGHIFFAHDEYAQSRRRTTDRGGYLNVENGNASLDGNGDSRTPPQQNALMLNNGNFSTHVPYAPSQWSSDMFGHRDTDGDGVPDILDTTPIMVGDDATSLLNTFTFTGSVEVSPIENQNPLNVNFSNSQSDMTINTIASAWYVLDGGAAIQFAALDGLYDDYFENLGFSIFGLSAGLHTIDVYTLNSVDNSSNMMTFNFTAAVPEPSGMVMLLAAGAFIIRRKRQTGVRV